MNFYPIEGSLWSDAFTRRSGEALHPERDTVATCEAIRDTIGDYHLQSQYQQSPMPLEGGMIQRDWLKLYPPEEEPELFRMVVQIWDTVNKAGEFNDFSVCKTWGIHSNPFYLLHVYRRRPF